MIYENLMEEIIDFQNDLDENHEVGVLLASFGSSVLMNVTELGYQNPDMLYFYGYVNGNEARLIQHVSQLNFLLMSVEKEDKTQPPRRIGFRSSSDEDGSPRSLTKHEQAPGRKTEQDLKQKEKQDPKQKEKQDPKQDPGEKSGHTS